MSQTAAPARWAKPRLVGPPCPHCGFEMTPLYLTRGLGIPELDHVVECRPCGMQTFTSPAENPHVDERAAALIAAPLK